MEWCRMAWETPVSSGLGRKGLLTNHLSPFGALNASSGQAFHFSLFTPVSAPVVASPAPLREILLRGYPPS